MKFEATESSSEGDARNKDGGKHSLLCKLSDLAPALAETVVLLNCRLSTSGRWEWVTLSARKHMKRGRGKGPV